MLIYPAIDLSGGKCVRLTKGQFDSSKIYKNDPIEMLDTLYEAGASWVHIVDLDGAKNGKITQLEVITKLINLGLGFAAIVTVVFLIIGGFWYLTSAGSEELAEKGRKTLVNSIIGLVIIIMAFAIVRIVGNLLQGNSSGGAPSTTQNPGGTTQPPANPPANGGSGESGGSITNSGDPSVAADNNYILVLSIPESKMSCGANSVNIYATVTQADGNAHSR